MTIFDDCFQNTLFSETVITIGTFDGVHKGHQKILERLNEIKTTRKLKSIVFTFHPHPRKIIQSHTNEIKILSTKTEKIQLLNNYNIDYLIFCPFTREFANIEPEDFVKLIATRLNVKHVIIGYDHKFGKNRRGNINTFLELKNIYNYEVEQIPPETVNEINISSTKIREFLLNGNIQKANELLAYPYFIIGKVTEGKKLGTSIGVPTANILTEDKDKLIPANGVYCTEVLINEKTYKGVMNIGTNPTTDKNNVKKLEVHILNFNQNIYHQKIQVSFIKKIRDEKKFESLDELKQQILKDIEICR